MTPVLRHVPADWLIPWQWWDDGQYLSGFITEAGARDYGRAKGWCDASKRHLTKQ
jgi:hypothetical protein